MRDLDAPSRALINGPTSADDVAVDGALISYVPLWADSDKDIADWAENGRGTFIRGPDAVASFLKRRDMDLVESAVRAGLSLSAMASPPTPSGIAPWSPCSRWPSLPSRNLGV